MNRFFVADGADGTGKTTQLRIIADKLKANGTPVYMTRLLGGTGEDWLQNQIRSLLLDPEFPHDSVLEEEELFGITDRRGLAATYKWLDENPTGIALMDRAAASHVCYAFAKGMTNNQVWGVHGKTFEEYARLADRFGLTSLIMVPEDEFMAMDRVKGRGGQVTPRLENAATQRMVIDEMLKFDMDHWLKCGNIVETKLTVHRSEDIPTVAENVKRALAGVGFTY